LKQRLQNRPDTTGNDAVTGWSRMDTILLIELSHAPDPFQQKRNQDELIFAG
jgi:hypothetical protein